MGKVMQMGGVKAYPETAIVEDIEQALLGALLVEDKVYDDCAYLKAEYFYQPAHARIFGTIKTLKEEGRAVTAQTIAQYFVEDPDLEQVGGAQYLYDLAGNVISTFAPTIKGYAEAIYQTHLRRALFMLGGRLKDFSRTADVSMTPKQIIGQAEQFIFEAVDDRGSDNVKAVGESVTRAIEMIKNPQSGIKSHFARLDYLLGGFKPENLYTIAARPGMGKSALGMTLSVNAAEAGKSVMYVSMEMSHEQLTQRILSRYMQQPVHSASNPDDIDWTVSESATERITRLPLYVDASASVTMADIAGRARRQKRVSGLDMLVVDYLGLIQSDNHRLNKVHQIEEITTGMKRLAGELGIPILLLSQLSRKVEERDDKRPKLSDLRDSGSIEQDSAVVIFIYREEYYLEAAHKEAEAAAKKGGKKYTGKAKVSEYEIDTYAELEAARGKAELIVAKNRHGKTGVARVKFNGEGQVFHD